MAITGAIFDCDGTLVDSMGMWHDVTVALLERHGAADAERVFQETEPLSFDDMCVAFHEKYGIKASAEQLVDELRAAVREGYRTVAPAYPGMREFVRSLHEAGIPLVVASSTMADDVRVALQAAGVEDCFQDVLFTGDVGFDKQHPDIYLEARRRLGTERATTWVFEDAPFGLRTAKHAGFPTVCIFNGHDGRDESFLRKYADIFAHSYAELSLALLQDFEAAPSADAVAGKAPLKALVVDGSPEPSSPELVRALAEESDYVVAADRGAEALHAAGVAPDAFCGDADSVSPEVAEWARAAAPTDIKFPTEKYATDLALAIACARHEAARQERPLELIITCATGGRADHQLAVMGQLANNADARPRLVEDGFECRVLSPAGEPSWQIGAEPGAWSGDEVGAEGATFSAIAVASDTRISEKGSKWELDDHEMGLLEDVGISNVVASQDCVVTCESGAVAVFLDVPPYRG